MSLYTAMRAGITGLASNASAMSVISDNVANVNTVGYKRGISDFSALINGYVPGAGDIGGGVTTSSRRLASQQGALLQTNSATDMAISGNGFFVVAETPNAIANGGSVAFTRSGSFGVDAKGYLVNQNGFYLQGWPVAADGTVSASSTSVAALAPVNVANVVANAEPSGEVALNANLNSNQTIYDPTVQGDYAEGAIADGTITPHFETSVEIYDSLGTPRTITLGFLKTDANTWQVEAYARPATSVPDAAGGLVASGTINFTTSGLVNSVTGTIGEEFAIPWDPSFGAADQALTLTFNTSQFATASAVSSVKVDGIPPGTLTSTSVDKHGVLTAHFSNGSSRSLYQLPLATFLSPDALLSETGDIYRATAESGSFNLVAGQTGGSGRIEGARLEASNVDLATEFANMITTQRAYSASSKIITTADQMLEELVQIKR